MRTVRCFVELPLQAGSELALPESVANHLLRVLRLSEGDVVTLFNGDGTDYAAQLIAEGRNRARARVVDSATVDRESPLRLTLAQGVARGDKMDLILQKATELGVSDVWPLLTERTEVRLGSERLEKRMHHWRAVIASACEQSGRARLPTLRAPQTIDELMAGASADALKLTLDPFGDQTISGLVAPTTAHVLFAIGPEGGFSQAERDHLRGAGFAGLRLGPRILRTETAGLAALAALQSRFGDLR